MERFTPVIQQMRSMLTAGTEFAIQADEKLARFPGLVESLSSLSQVVVFVLEPAAAALGALQRAGKFAEVRGGVSLTRSLQWDQAAIPCDGTSGGAVSTRAKPQRHPSHLLYRERAYRLGSQVFNIGTELPPGDYGVIVPSGNGVSRRHCSIRIADHGVEIVDHSRYGTRLNGHQIEGSAILHVGDVLSVGQPAVEFRLIAEALPGTVTDGT